MIGAKSGIDAQHREHALHHGAGADQQDAGERDFRHDQRAPHSARRRAGVRATGLVQENIHVRARGLKRRDDPEENAGDNRGADREQEHGEIHLNVVRPGDEARPAP